MTAATDVPVDQVIYLQDFPKTAADVRALLDLNFTQIDGVYIIEEIFNRDIEDEGDTQESQADLSDPTAEDQEVAGAGAPTETAQSQMNATGEIPKPKEKKFNKLNERASAFEEIVEINRILKR